MEKLPTVIKLEKKSQKSSKKTPVKVVYISNPMKIKATPSEFRAVVQQFTGRYAASPPLAPVTDHHCKQEVIGCAGGGVHSQQKWQLNRSFTIDDASPTTTTAGSDVSDHESGCREDEGMNDLITPQMLENFPPLFTHGFGS